MAIGLLGPSESPLPEGDFMLLSGINCRSHTQKLVHKRFLGLERTKQGTVSCLAG
jgi:hypothetical protein